MQYSVWLEKRPSFGVELFSPVLLKNIAIAKFQLEENIVAVLI